MKVVMKMADQFVVDYCLVLVFLLDFVYIQSNCNMVVVFGLKLKGYK